MHNCQLSKTQSAPEGIKDVRPAFRYLAAHGISAALAWPADLQQYLDSLAGRYRPTTIRRKSVSLRAVYLALAETGAIPANPTVYLAAPKRRPASRKPPLPTQTAKRLLAAPQPSSAKGVRDHAILTGLLCHGLSVSELSALDVADSTWRRARSRDRTPRAGAHGGPDCPDRRRVPTLVGRAGAAQAGYDRVIRFGALDVGPRRARPTHQRARHSPDGARLPGPGRRA